MSAGPGHPTLCLLSSLGGGRCHLRPVRRVLPAASQGGGQGLRLARCFPPLGQRTPQVPHKVLLHALGSSQAVPPGPGGTLPELGSTESAPCPGIPGLCAEWRPTLRPSPPCWSMFPEVSPCHASPEPLEPGSPDGMPCRASGEAGAPGWAPQEGGVQAEQLTCPAGSGSRQTSPEQPVGSCRPPHRGPQAPVPLSLLSPTTPGASAPPSEGAGPVPTVRGTRAPRDGS